jgi:acetolactate synthase-1/2/3 large subunit
VEERLQLLAELLVKNGLKYAFGITGSGYSITLITELENHGVLYFPASHEASAALMAGAVTKASETFSLSIGIKGPGLANMFPGIVSNYFENIPALSASEAFGIETPSYRKHKRLDHYAFLSSIAKGFISLSELEDGLTDLLQIAKREVPGPVHLDLCLSDRLNNQMTNRIAKSASRQNDHAKGEFFRNLAKSEKPVLIVGSLVSRRSYGKYLQNLRIPVFTTASAKGVLDERHAHCAGVYTGVGRELAPESKLFGRADLIIAMGLRNTEVIQPRSLGKPLIMFDEVDHGLSEGFNPDVLLIGSKNIATDIFIEIQDKSWGMDIIQNLLTRLKNHLLSDAWLPATCFDILNRLNFPHGLVLDTGSFCAVGEHLWQAGADRYFMGSSNGRYMGASIPSAVGVAICRPGLPVFCAMGDGGMHMYPAEIKLAVQERLPICFLFMTDGRYGSILSQLQSKTITRRAIDILQPSWFRSIEAMGCEVRRVRSENTFERTLATWDREGPLFIENPFNPEVYANMVSKVR